MSDKSLLVVWRTRIAAKIGYLLLYIIWLKSGGWCWCSWDSRNNNNNNNNINVDKFTITHWKKWTLNVGKYVCLEYGMTCMQCNVKWYCHFYFTSTQIASVGVRYWSFTFLLVPLMQPLLHLLIVLFFPPPLLLLRLFFFYSYSHDITLRPHTIDAVHEITVWKKSKTNSKIKRKR